MFSYILLAIASALAFDYKAGDRFSYTYSSRVETAALGPSSDSSSSVIDMTCTANFEVLTVVADGVYLKSTVSDFNGNINGGGSSETISKRSEIDQLLSAPLLFKLKNDGSVTDVVADKFDSEEILNIKTAVAFSLRTHLNAVSQNEYQQDTVIDNMGKHVEYTSVSQRSNAQTINTFFSDSDFIGFADRNLDRTYVAIDSHSSHVIVDGKVNSATSELTIILNKKADATNTAADDVQIISVGTEHLSNYQETKNTVPSGTWTSLAKFLSENRNYAVVSKFREAYYLHAFAAAPSNDIVIGEDCPGNIDLCKSIDGTWSVGNPNIGLNVHVWALVGVTTGCTEAHRSYMAGAYAQLDLLLLQRTLNVVDAYIEYGQVNGVAKRNAISLSLFGESVYHQDIPYLNCIVQNYPLASFNKEYRLPYNTQVYIVTLTFYVSVTVNLSAVVTVKICPMAFDARVTLTPKAALALGGGAEASVVIARAGITLRGSANDYLDPTAYVDGNLCRVGFFANNYFGGITASLVGYWQLFDLINFIKTGQISWGVNHEYPIWSYSFPSRTDKIIDVYWGADSQ